MAIHDGWLATLSIPPGSAPGSIGVPSAGHLCLFIGIVAYIVIPVCRDYDISKHPNGICQMCFIFVKDIFDGKRTANMIIISNIQFLTHFLPLHHQTD